MKITCAECHNEETWGTMGRCPRCGGILQPIYDDGEIAVLRDIVPGPGIDRYAGVLPVSHPLPTMGEGDTPLVMSRRMGRALGLQQLYFKNEGRNPSGAFKDRAGVMVAGLALEAGKKGLVTASSGNSAAAASAYCAAAGLRCLILLEPGNPPAKLRQTLATGALVLPVEGVFSHGPDATRDLIMDVARLLDFYPAFVWAPVNPYALEGIKTISYEVAARLPGPPDVVVCPVGGGDMLAAQWRGYLELQRAGVIDRLPRMIAVQSVSASPLLDAYRAGADRVGAIEHPHSRLSGINVPFTGEHALAAVRASGGTVVGITDDEAFAMQAALAREEGVWAEPASSAPLAALPRLLEDGLLDPGERTVCLLSGAGWKDAELAREEAEAANRSDAVVFDAEAVAQAAQVRLAQS